MYDEFGISMRLPEMKEGDTLYFVVSQRTPLGWMNWSYVPGGDVKNEAYPAPFVTFFLNNTLTKLNTTALNAAARSDAASVTVQAVGLITAFSMLSLLL